MVSIKETHTSLCRWHNNTRIVPEGLDSVTAQQIKKTCRDYENAYREGGTWREVEECVKLYKSGRRVYSEHS